MAWSDRGEAEDAAAIDCDVRHSEVLPKLVLAGIPVEESVELLVARLEGRAVARDKASDVVIGQPRISARTSSPSSNKPSWVALRPAGKLRG